MEKISVLICAYQAQDTLWRCVRSAVLQNVRNLEIVIINDGSTDKTGMIAQRLAEKYSCVKVIHQSNKGVAAARNRALEESSGEWILFLDSDDALMPGAIKAMIHAQRISGADFVGTAHRSAGKILRWRTGTLKTVELSKKERLVKLLEDRTLKNYVWGKLIHRRVFEGIVFPEGKSFEDVAVMASLLINSEKMILIPKVTTEYTVGRAGSISNGLKPECMKDYLDAMHLQIQTILRIYPELEPQCKKAVKRVLRLYRLRSVFYWDYWKSTMIS